MGDTTGELMSFLTTAAVKRNSIDSLLVLAGVAALLDTAIGTVAALGLDWSSPHEAVMGVSFVLGLPVYLLDLWLNRRIAFGLAGLFLFRWVARCFGGPTPVLCNPFVWPVGILLFLALACLQTSRLRSER